MPQRSHCPISTALDILGDKWSLLVIRDLLFFGKQSFSELKASEEKIATNILSKRLEALVAEELVVVQPHLVDKRKKHYRLTQKGRDLLPAMLEIMVWSDTYYPDMEVPTELIRRVKEDRAQLLLDIQAKLSTEQ